MLNDSFWYLRHRFFFRNIIPKNNERNLWLCLGIAVKSIHFCEKKKKVFQLQNIFSSKWQTGFLREKIIFQLSRTKTTGSSFFRSVFFFFCIIFAIIFFLFCKKKFLRFLSSFSSDKTDVGILQPFSLLCRSSLSCRGGRKPRPRAGTLMGTLRSLLF